MGKRENELKGYLVSIQAVESAFIDTQLLEGYHITEFRGFYYANCLYLF